MPNRPRASAPISIPPELPPSPADTTNTMILGELRGQFRELIHTVNNMSQKLDAVGEKVLLSSNLPEVVSDHERRIKVLETREERRLGAMSLGGWLMRSPLVGWLATAAAVLWGLFHKGA